MATRTNQQPLVPLSYVMGGHTALAPLMSDRHGKMNHPVYAQSLVEDGCRELIRVMITSEKIQVDDTITDGHNGRQSLSLLLAIAYNDIELIEFIASRTKCINTVYIHNAQVMWTPLLWAIRSCNIDAVTILIKHGADTNMGVSDIMTPVRLAIRTRCALSMVRLLLANGVQSILDPSLLPYTIHTLLKQNAKREVMEMVELLVANGVNVNGIARGIELNEPKKNADVKWTRNALMIALHYHEYALAERLIREWHIDIIHASMIGANERTILHSLVAQASVSRRKYVPVPISLVRAIIDTLLSSSSLDDSLLTQPLPESSLSLFADDAIRLEIESAVTRIHKERERRLMDACEWSKNQISNGKGTAMMGAIFASALTNRDPQLQLLADDMMRYIPGDVLARLFNTALQSKIIAVNQVPSRARRR